MILHYRIIDVDEPECSITVRHWTDSLSEADLRTDPEDANDPPLRCRTDARLTLYDPGMTEEALHLMLMRAANTRWLMLQEQVKAQTPPDMSAAKAIAGQTFSCPVLPTGEVDLSSHLE